MSVNLNVRTLLLRLFIDCSASLRCFTAAVQSRAEQRTVFVLLQDSDWSLGPCLCCYRTVIGLSDRVCVTTGR